MDERQAVEQLVQKVKEYARGRARDVARIAESPDLAALLVQKYGTGIADAVATIFDSPRAADPLTKVLDEELGKIDPDWRSHAEMRWAARPADVVDRKETAASKNS